METELPPDPTSAPESLPEPLPEAAPIVLPVAPLPADRLASAPAVPTLPVPEVAAYTDRGSGLVVFGVFQIILGLLAALMVPLVALGAFMSRLAPGGSMRPGQISLGSRDLRIHLRSPS